MNLKNIIFQGLLIALPTMLTAQSGLINNGADIRITATTDLKINNGGVINKNNGNINNEGNLYVDLDWTQSGATTSYTGSGLLSFEGNGNQTLSSTQPIAIARLRVDNGNRLILNTNVTVSDQVDLINNGNIELGASNLELASGATVTNFDHNHFVITNSTGVLQQEVGNTNVVFPVGNSTYNPATLNNAGTLDNFGTRVEDQVLDNGTTGTPETQDIVNRSWHITEATTGGSAVTLTVQWNVSDELPGFIRAQSGVAHWNGSTWEHPTTYAAATPVGASFMHTRTGISSFSPFAVEDIKETLPIELSFFEAQRLDKDNVQLDWATVSETNNRGFEIERMLDTESEFHKINWVDGVGNSTSYLRYNLNDVNSHKGISYYRLKQIDFDGTYSYSPVRAVAGNQSNNNTIQVYPVPTKDHLIVDLSNWDNDDVAIKIIDVHGRILFVKEITIQQNHLIKIDEVRDLPSGTYFVSIGNDRNYKIIRKIIKE